VTVRIVHGNALALPIEDDSVDLVVTSPPYFGLRSYQDGGEHYTGQVGSEATPKEFVDALIAATAEMVRVVKPSGSIWVNLGDKYSQRTAGARSSHQSGLFPDRPELAKDWKAARAAGLGRMPKENVTNLDTGAHVPEKSLMGLPWRYALRCIDDLGLILRAEVIWSKPNGLPESVRDRVRRSHEQWFHFALSPRYYANVDEVREPHAQRTLEQAGIDARRMERGDLKQVSARTVDGDKRATYTPPPNPLGKLPGSVWTIATQPLRVPAELGIDHFAAFPMEWPRRIITGWSPPGICTACGEGRRAVTATKRHNGGAPVVGAMYQPGQRTETADGKRHQFQTTATITGYACDCPTPDAPTRPAVVLDPFGGTGTTALVADVLGRDGISVDLSEDYCRLAEWRTQDPKERARVLKVKPLKPAPARANDEGDDDALFPAYAPAPGE